MSRHSAKRARSHVISVRLDDEMLQAVDLLVRAGLFQSRSEAASQLIKAGVQASGEWLRQAQEIADSVQKMKQAFMEAVKQKDVRTVSLLLEQDGRLAADYAEQPGDTPLLQAVYYGAEEVKELLLARGVRLNLFEAAAVGDVKALEKLLADAPRQVNAYSHDGWTPLHLASFFGREDAARLLLGRGADVRAVSRNRMENTPLHAALAGGHGGIALMLLDSGADAEAADSAGWTPWHHAAAHGLPHVAERLLKSGADVNSRNRQGVTPLGLALQKRQTEIAALLRAHGGTE
ncbi:ankyrin repeat domain-containing protein [Brevibacillus thermoruber]|uniref:ankyrin repeat domain-containing protein n=1 Tax=Brevibacillus thermoruber TaxID=33942 RepID=UPI0012E0ACAE|nr:ankyrin repeat domain-containing protein [Brevibacillus thermoruber]